MKTPRADDFKQYSHLLQSDSFPDERFKEIKLQLQPWIVIF